MEGEASHEHAPTPCTAANCARRCAFALSDQTASCVDACSCCAQYAAVLNCRASRSNYASVVPSRCSVLRSTCRRENVQFDKITARIKKLCYGLDDRYVDPIILSQKVIQGEQSLTALSTCCTSHLGLVPAHSAITCVPELMLP
eukprot:869-Heterococcus_DN1.PRE.3